jgi:signal transduction histidine kinase
VVVIRPRLPILVKFLAAFAVPTLVLFAVFAYVAYDVTERDLDEELGARMRAVAASAAPQLQVKYIDGNEEVRAVERGRLQRLADATGVHYFVFDRSYQSVLDTDPLVRRGDEYTTARLDEVEIQRVFAEGEPVASVITFEGEDHREHKSGYAPLRDADGNIQYVVGAEAPADYFDRLESLRESLIWWGVRIAIFVLLASVVSTVLVTRPLRRLAGAADRIGKGDLEAPVKVTSNDEIGRLAETMDHMRAQLRERDARMQQMLAGIAHEVRNPLAGMTLFTGILQDELAGDERRAHVEKIARELGYLERVVQDFLEYARRPVPVLADVAVRPLLVEVAGLVSPEIEVSGDASVHADAGQLRRALLNLTRNAVQAGDQVRLETRRNGGTVEIDVVNRGPAIPADVRERIFEPFFTTREKGTGLGLAFAREIARAHGGDLTVACDDGETRFRVTLESA